MDFKAHPTAYRGIKFRSRLEATWAAFFDELKWDWSYEPFDLNGWVPDFILTFPHDSLLVEIKPGLEFQEQRDPLLARYEKSVAELLKPILLCGRDPFQAVSTNWSGQVAIGYYLLINEWANDDPENETTSTFNTEVILAKCKKTNQFAIGIDDQDIHSGSGFFKSLDCMQCGGSSDELSEKEWCRLDEVGIDEAKKLFSTAKNKTQWNK
jgi:hypothetical protein